MNTPKRDRDIMAIDHAVRALLKSTPRMLEANLEMVRYIIQRLINGQKEKTFKP